MLRIRALLIKIGRILSSCISAVHQEPFSRDQTRSHPAIPSASPHPNLKARRNSEEISANSLQAKAPMRSTVVPTSSYGSSQNPASSESFRSARGRGSPGQTRRRASSQHSGYNPGRYNPQSGSLQPMRRAVMAPAGLHEPLEAPNLEDKVQFPALGETGGPKKQDNRESAELETVSVSSELTRSTMKTVKTVKTENLDQYVVKNKDFFRPGKVFEVLQWCETGGQNSGKKVHKTDRPMVVIKRFWGHCLCLPVYSHKKKGSQKSGLHISDRAQYAVIYDKKFPLEFIEEEIGQQELKAIHPARIPVEMVHGRVLELESRLRFNYVCTVQYNFRVRELGDIEDVPSLVRYFLEALVQYNVHDNRLDDGLVDETTSEQSSMQYILPQFGQMLLSSDRGRPRSLG